MKKNWQKSGNEFYLTEVSDYVEKLSPGIYRVEVDQFGRFYLAHTESKFGLPDKIYDFEDALINRFIKTYQHTTGNLGLLLNGLKGTGKTVTSKILCNQLNLPILVVSKKFDALPSFINSIQQDIVIFFDEYEKIYNNYDSSILTVMDGVLDNGYRKIFLLTTNSLHVNENLLQRPSRIRYTKTFTDLSIKGIREILNDLLINKDLIEETEKFISGLEIITVDIVKTIVQEVNIHNESPEKFKDVFNVSKGNSSFNVYALTIENNSIKESLIKANCRLNYSKFTEDDLEEDIYINGNYFGVIKEVFSRDQCRVQVKTI